jgi:hypothetical protein
LGNWAGKGKGSPVRAYQLYLKGNGNAWEWIGTLEAATHADAFGQALLCLSADEMGRPVRIEEDHERAYRKPLRLPQERRTGCGDELPATRRDGSRR